MRLSLFSTKLLLSLGLLLSTTGILAEPMSMEESHLLERMVTAAQQTNYSGIFIYQSGSYIETSLISHLFDGQDEHEKLEGLDGERSEVIRKNDKVWCYLGDGKVMVAKREGTRTFPALLPRQLSLLQDNYVIYSAVEDRVAGFNAQTFIFKPRDKMRYTHKMWVHSENALLLKSVVMDEQGHVIEQYSFTQLNIGGNFDRGWINPDKKIDQVAASNSSILNAKESGWIVYALPAGFKKIKEVTRLMNGNSLPVTHLIYSDGLAGISVFIERLDEKSKPKTGLYSKGVTQVFLKVLDENLLTVVGEVPPRTVIQVAESVRYGGQLK